MVSAVFMYVVEHHSSTVWWLNSQLSQLSHSFLKHLSHPQGGFLINAIIFLSLIVANYSARLCQLIGIKEMLSGVFVVDLEW